MGVRDKMQNLKLCKLELENIKNISLLFLNKNNKFADGYEPLKAIIDKDLFPKILNIYNNPIATLLSNPVFEEFSYDGKDDGTIQCLGKDDPQLNTQVLFKLLTKSIQEINSSNVDTISNLDSVMSSSSLYAFVFNLNDDSTFTIVRKIYSSNYLDKNGVFFFKKSRLNTLKENLFSIDSKIDFILYKDFIYILGKYNFESLFSYNYHFQNKANNLLVTLEDSNILENYKEFKEDCLDRRSIVKKLAILEASGDINSFLNKLDNNPKFIQDTIKKYNLNITLNSENKIIYSDVATLSEIINLISENYFVSDITQRKCLANRKTYLTDNKPKKKSRTRKKK